MLTRRRFSRPFGLIFLVALASTACSVSAAQTWSGLKVSGQNTVDSSGRNFVLKGFGVGEWTNTEAYMLEWPDGNGRFLWYFWYYGYTRIHNTLETLMGEEAADQYGAVKAHLSISTLGSENAKLDISWNDRQRHGIATISGIIGGRNIAATMYAP